MRRTTEARLAAARYFDNTGRHYASAYREPSPGGHALRVRQQRVLEQIGSRPGKVLDVGCGPGFLAEEVLDRGGEVWGIDVAPRMIEECRRRLGHCQAAHFAVGDATHLAFPNGMFDVAVCLGVIDYIPACDAAVRELIRVVKPGGAVLVSFPNLLSPYAVWKLCVFYPVVALCRPLYIRLTGRPRVPLRPLWVTKMHTIRAVIALMSRHGASVASVTYYNFNIFLSPLDEVLSSKILRVLSWLERLRNSSLRWLGAGFIVQALKVDHQ